MKKSGITGYFRFLLNRPEAFRERLLEPFLLTWIQAESEKQYRRAIREIQENFPFGEEARDLWFLRRAAEYLVWGKQAPVWIRPLLREAPEWDRMFPGQAIDSILDGFWAAVPVILVADRREFLRYIIAGRVADAGAMGRLWPGWADPLMDGEAAAAVEQAADAAMVQHETVPGADALYCFPLIEPNGRQQIEGASLGLPMALGFLSALGGSGFPEGAAATGAVNSGGEIRAVSCVERKHALAYEKNFRLFLHPVVNGIVFERSAPEAIAVENLSDAQVAAELFRPGNSAELVLLSRMRKDAQVFLDNCLSVPSDWIGHILNPVTRRFLMKCIRYSPGMFKSLVGIMERALDRHHLETARHLAALADPCDSGILADTAPEIWFAWCTRNLALCNHMGGIREARRWADAAGQVRQRAMCADDALGEMADYYNNEVVGMLHNQYDFSPVLPEGSEEHLRYLENRFRNDLEYNPSATSRRLGELYGTLTQHFAFCGPAYLETTLEYSRMARRAFGKGRAPELRGEWRRQYNYLVYAFLDAGNSEAAEKSLMAYLEAASWDDVREKAYSLVRWDHAVLARFIADTGCGTYRMTLVENLVQAAREIGAPEHPWQLWHYNMGRIFLEAGNPDRAETFFRKSLELCISRRFGPTVRVMALLPMSALHACDYAADRVGIETGVRSAAMELNEKYFAFLANLSFGEALQYVHRNAALVFPFSYR